MYNLTPDQYDTFHLAAHNFCVLAQGDRYCHYYLEQLADYTSILTGTYPSQDTLRKALDTARSYNQDDSKANCDAVIKLFIGPFSLQKQSQLHNLTTAQYGILRTTAHNLCMTANDKDLSDNHYQMYLLADQIAILTGEFPEDSVCHKAAEKAKALGVGKSLDECMENAVKVLEVFLGSFTYDEE